MQQAQFVFSGFGGQGVMFAGQLLAYTAMDHGMNVTWIPSYGPEMRGGTANCTIVISEKPIGSPLVKHPKVAVVFNNPSFDKYEPVVSDLLVYNSSLVERRSDRIDLEALAIPATELAYDIGNVKMMNMIMLSATLARFPVLSLDALRESLAQHIPEHHRDSLPVNYKAIDIGEKYAAPSLLMR